MKYTGQNGRAFNIKYKNTYKQYVTVEVTQDTQHILNTGHAYGNISNSKISKKGKAFE
jgi:hypothetical protein